MRSSALSYGNFIHPENESCPLLRNGLRAIQELDSTVFYPLLIRFYSLMDVEGTTFEHLVSALDALESFYVRRAVCGVPTNALNKMTLELCSNFPETSPHLWLRERLMLGSGGRRWPTDEEFSEALVVQRIYPRRKLARYMLEALELTCEHKEKVDASAATMEHIMPQTLSPSWLKSLGETANEIHEKWLDTLGNLTLTGYNSELGNASFDEKKIKLKNTHFELSRELLDQNQWGAPQIEARGRHLAEVAVKRWRRE